MIFVNGGEDLSKHEILTRGEFEAKYGPLPQSNATQEHRRLRNHRMVKRVTMGELAERLSKETGKVWTPLLICDLESGRMDADLEAMQALYLKCLGSLTKAERRIVEKDYRPNRGGAR